MSARSSEYCGLRTIIRWPSIIFGAPLLIAVLFSFVVFDLPGEYQGGVLYLTVPVFVAIAGDFFFKIRLPTLQALKVSVVGDDRYFLLARCFGVIVLVACIVDILAFPLPLLNPEIYIDFSGGRNHVRHISNMCWVLPVIGFVCFRRKTIAWTFVAVAFLFPVLVLDRNRLFASAYSSFFVAILFRRDIPWRSIVAGGVGLLVVFGQLGVMRSGNLRWVALPFSSIYDSLPLVMKWLFLYISAGVYNFGSIAAKGFLDDSVLIHQLAPWLRPASYIDTALPLDVAAINVGTEFFPFLLAYGPLGAIASAILLYLGLVASIRFFQMHTCVFSMLIFLRISYVCLMSGFAPQAFMWTNFGFVVLCLGGMVVSNWPSRRRFSNVAEND